MAQTPNETGGFNSAAFGQELREERRRVWREFDFKGRMIVLARGEPSALNYQSGFIVWGKAGKEVCRLFCLSCSLIKTVRCTRGHFGGLLVDCFMYSIKKKNWHPVAQQCFIIARSPGFESCLICMLSTGSLGFTPDTPVFSSTAQKHPLTWLEMWNRSVDAHRSHSDPETTQNYIKNTYLSHFDSFHCIWLYAKTIS